MSNSRRQPSIVDREHTEGLPPPPLPPNRLPHPRASRIMLNRNGGADADFETVWCTHLRKVS